MPKMAALFTQPSPAPVKAALNAQHWLVGSTLPILPLTTNEQSQLLNSLNNAERLVVPQKRDTEPKIIRKVVTMMCGWAFTGGMPFMWMGGGLGIISLLILLAVGAYFLGTRSRHHD